MPLLFTVFVRLAIAVGFVFYICNSLTNFSKALIISICLVLVAMMILSRRLKHRSIRLERMFVLNLRSRDIEAEVHGHRRPLYEGRLLDGTVFDASAKHGDQPSEFTPEQVIRGWTEALTMMPVGSKWQLFIPYELAYGGRGAGQIQPYSTLIFDVELVGISRPETESPEPVAKKGKTSKKTKK